MSRSEPFRASECTSSLTSCSGSMLGKTRSIPSGRLGLRHLRYRLQCLSAVLRIFHLSLRPMRGDQNAATLIREFLDFHNFEVRETNSALGGTHRQVFDKNGERYDLREVFDAYMRFGGMPGIADIGLDQEKALSLLEGIYSTVVVRDILATGKTTRPATDHRLCASA